MFKLIVDGKECVVSQDSEAMLKQSAIYLEQYGYVILSQDDYTINMTSGVSL